MAWRFPWANLLLAVLSPVVVFGALELLLAGLGIEPVRYREDPYVGFSSFVPLFEPRSGPLGEEVLSTAPHKLRLFNPQEFPRRKPVDTTRVFCLGGSTTYGRPYGDATSFCGWLRELLPEVDASRRWELINAGGISYASYRSAIVLQELLPYEPDLFLIYSGHNEFLEQRTYSRVIATPPPLRGLGALASRTRIYALLRRALVAPREAREAADGQRIVLDAEVRTLLDASVGPDAYHRDDLQRARILEHYRFNLARMVDMARAAGARAVLLTPAANLRHSSPFKSEFSATLDDAERARIERLLATAASAASPAGEALALLDEAVALDPRFAQAHFLRARVLDALGRYDEAKSAYERARDEDVCPLRAPGAARRVVLEVATERGVPVVDYVALVESTAPQGIPGEETFFDHVHPKIAEHRRLALAILETLRAEGIVAREATWNGVTLARVGQRIEAGLDRLAHGRALLNLSKVLGWAGKLEEAGRLAQLAVEQAPELPEVHYQAGQCALLTERDEDAIRHYRRALELAPGAPTTHGNLAVALERQGQSLQAVFHYRRAISLLGERDSSYRDSLIEALARLGATP